MKNLIRSLSAGLVILLFLVSSKSIIAQQYTITLVVDNECGGILEGNGAYTTGTVVPISITLADGYKFVNWTDEDGVAYPNPSFSYTVTNKNKTFTAHLTLHWQKTGTDIYFNGGNVGIGTEPTDKALTVNGTIHTTEVLVAAMGADFVFEENYNLISLEEVENFIKTNKHLPDIPSAREMRQKGMDLGEMGTKLLQKIEELTLHMIEMKKENTELREKINEFKTAINRD